MFLQQSLREVEQSPASDTTGLVPGCGFSPVVCLNTSRETVVVLLPSLRENGHAL